LAFTHGPLLISVEALALRSRRSNSGTEITAVAQKTATSLASAIAKVVPTSPED
jgi:hypothetical protein